MDPHSLKSRIYYLAGPRVQNLALGYWGRRLAGFRFGEDYDGHLRLLRESEHWDRDRVATYRDRSIAETVARAYEETSYYRSLMDRLGLRPHDVETARDLEKLPVLTKADVVGNFDGLVSSAFSRRDLVVAETSGSTGRPLRSLWATDGLAFRWAVWWRHRERFGLSRGARHAKFTPKPLVGPRQANPPHWRWNRVENQAIVPMQQIRPDRIERIAEFLERTDFSFFSGPTSILHDLSVTGLERGLSLSDGPRMVFAGSEGLHEFQRGSIELFTGSTISQMYGLAEGAGNASQCEHGVYHEDFEFGHLECVDGETDDSGARRGRIVLTGFANPAFPLIRYDTGDVGSWHDDAYACRCGRTSSALRDIEGRANDFLLTPEGHRISMLGHVFKRIDGLREAQVVQVTPKQIEINLSVGRDFSSRSESEIAARMASWVSESFEIEFVRVDAIPRDAGGKFRAIVNRLNEI